jgi:hypothetical protein
MPVLRILAIPARGAVGALADEVGIERLSHFDIATRRADATTDA